ncbi:hypothetical protein [Melioribacter sp. OK-6-Me]|uniref:hypothetical protein n=1 Tax=unclassified Melioribacter TaxID=2627329 RepID=UPI003ED919CE
MDKINIKTLIEVIIKEVIKELEKRGYEFTYEEIEKSKNDSFEIDMSNFKTPVLTENMLMQIEKNFSEIIIPTGTVITPGAKEFLNQRRIKINYKQIG